MSLEKIVRPFQLDDPFTARLPPAADVTPQDQEDAVLVISSRANTEFIDEPPPYALGMQAEWQEDRSQRVTEVVRVKQESNPDNFVDIERIKKMSFRNTRTNDQLPLNLDWSA